MVRWTAWYLRVLWDAIRVVIGPKLPVVLRSLAVARESLGQRSSPRQLRRTYDIEPIVSRRARGVASRPH